MPINGDLSPKWTLFDPDTTVGIDASLEMIRLNLEYIQAVLKWESTDTLPAEIQLKMKNIQDQVKGLIWNISNLENTDDFHDELQREVLRMIETKTTPTGERYQTREYRKDDGRKENAEEFLLRVYAKFTKPIKESTDNPFPLQGIYQDQIGKIDPELLVAINQYVRIRERKTSEFILPKSERVDKKISLASIDNRTLFSIHSRFYRNKNKKQVR